MKRTPRSDGFRPDCKCFCLLFVDGLVGGGLCLRNSYLMAFHVKLRLYRFDLSVNSPWPPSFASERRTLYKGLHSHVHRSQELDRAWIFWFLGFP